MPYLSLITLLGAAAAIPGGPAAPAKLESVYAVSQSSQGVTVNVRSNGCTSAASFTVATAPIAGGTALTLHRARPDYCRAFLREGVSITWTWAELGIAPTDHLVLVNPIIEH